MKFLKVSLFVVLTLSIAGCGGGEWTHEECVKKAKAAMVKNGTPEAEAGALAESSCAACKENMDVCKALIEGHR